MAARTALGLILLAGAGGVGYYLWQRQNAEQEAAQAQYIEAVNRQNAAIAAQNAANTRTQRNALISKRNALISTGLDTIMNFFRRSTPTAQIPTRRMFTRAPAGGTNGLRELLTLLGRLESGNDYNRVYGGSVIRPPKPITQMTVGEVRAWQDRSVRAGSKSSAVGYYQIIRITLDSLIAQGHASRTDLFNSSTQDRLGMALLERRGLSRYRRSAKTEDDVKRFAQSLSEEWASFPAITVDKKGRPARGQSYYAGDGLNRAHVSIPEFLAVVRRVR